MYQKTIKTLLAKLNDLDAKQQTELQRIQLEDDEKERGKAEGLRERESLEEGLAESGSRLHSAQTEVARMSHVLQEVQGNRRTVVQGSVRRRGCLERQRRTGRGRSGRRRREAVTT